MRRHRFALLRLLVLLAIVVAFVLVVRACQPGPAPIASPTPAPVVTPTAAQTVAPTPSSSPTPAPTVRPTSSRVPTPSAKPTLPPTSTEASSFESRHFLWHLNVARKAAGMPYLARDLTLDAVARTRTATLVACGCLYHDISYVVVHTKFAVVGEIVGWSTFDHAWLVAAFLDSTPHRTVIYGAWTRFGSSVVTLPDGRVFATVLFGRR